MCVGVSAFGADYYYSKTQQGLHDGTSCANSWAYDDATNGWNVAAKQGPDVVAHICSNGGDIVIAANGTAITVATQGTSGHIYEIRFESGAVLSSPAFSSSKGAIYINGKNYVLVNGGNSCAPSTGTNCGVIKNTDNGSILTYQQTSYGVVSTGSSNIEIKNIAFLNLYQNNGDFSSDAQNAANMDAGGASSTAIHAPSSTQNSLSFHDNYIDMVSIGIDYGYSGKANNGLSIYNNTIKDIHWGISTGASSSVGADVQNAYIYNNTITKWLPFACPASSSFCFLSAWDSGATYAKNIGVTYLGTNYKSLQNSNVNHLPTDGAWWVSTGTIPDTYHKDGIINSKGIGGTVLTHLFIYNNYIYGDMRSGSTAGILCAWSANGALTGSNNLECDIYNNVINMTAAGSAIWINECLPDQKIYNNTLYGNVGGSAVISTLYDRSGARCGVIMGTTITEANNVIANASSLISAGNTGSGGTPNSFTRTITSSDYNAFSLSANYPNGRVFDSADYKTWNVSDGSHNPWTAQVGGPFDLHGLYNDTLNINTTTWIPNVGSPVIVAGQDLTSLCSTYTGLCNDKAGAGRPNGSAWDIGAYQYVSAGLQALQVDGSGNANGTVCTDGTTCADGIINCTITSGVTSGTCSHNFTAGSTPTLTAHATSGSFTTFSGGGCSTSPCTVTMNSPQTVVATFAFTPTCSLTCVSNNLNLPQTVSCTTSLANVSGTNSSWFIIDPLNVAIGVCNYPFSGCTASGQTGNLPYTVSGIYTLGAIANGVSCTPSTQPLNINTPAAGAVGH